MSISNIFKKVHLWLGIATGPLVFIIALTGALYAFQEEITGWGKYHDVVDQSTPLMPPSQLAEIAVKALPGKELHAIKYNRRQKASEAIFYSFQPDYYFIVYLNPYNGTVQKVKDMNRDFFRLMIIGHYYLWLPPNIGQPVVAWSTLIFAIVLLTGLFIWMPRTRKAWKNRLLIRWKKDTKWPRINFDLHAIGGLYAIVFALIFAITGLVWGFQWFAQGYYQLTGGEKSLVYSDIYSKKQLADTIVTSQQSIDRVWLLMQQEYPNASSIEIHPTHTDSSAIAANANQQDGKYWKTDYRYFDQHTLKELNADHIYGRYQDARFADKLIRMNYEIHTGAILGLPGKIFACLMSLLIASLPITGYIIWWKKRKRKWRGK